MAIIVTYDIPSKHPEFKKAVFELGYSATTKDSENRTINLPNTTLYHATKTSGEALDDTRNLCARLGIRLERCVSILWSGWSAIFGEPFK